MKAKVIAKIHKRLWPHTGNKPLPGPLIPNDIIEIVEVVEGEFVSASNNIWYKTDKNFYVWSEGVEALTEEIPGNIKVVKRKTPEKPAIPVPSKPSALQKFNELEFWWLSNFNIGKLWNESLSGSNVKMVVLDSGVSLPHPDLVLDEKLQMDFSKSKSGIKDWTGHGTHVSGIIRAINNGFGIKGIAFGAELIVGKIKNDVLGDKIPFLVSGIEWAVQNKVDIISISYGFAANDPALEAIIKKASDQNMLVVCAAGNRTASTGNDILYPARYEDTLSVGGVTHEGLILANTINASQTDLFAPGAQIKSTFLNEAYADLSGSSQAAPYVAGVAALLLEAARKSNPSYKAFDLKEHLIKTADPTSFGKLINPLTAYNKL